MDAWLPVFDIRELETGGTHLNVVGRGVVRIPVDALLLADEF